MLTTKEEQLVILFDTILGHNRGHQESKKQVRYDCPVCAYEKGVHQDGKGNFEINYGLGIFRCWSCGDSHGTRGTVKKLFSRFSSPNILGRFKRLGIKWSYTHRDDKIIDYDTRISVPLPDEYISMGEVDENFVLYKPFFSYLYDRGITKRHIIEGNLGFAIEGKYKDRIIIPSTDEEDVPNYFVTRSIHNWSRNKYLNPRIDKDYLIFNEGVVDWTKTIFLVEGVFDHIVLPNSIPVLGKSLGELLYNRLYHDSEGKILICLDPDANKDARTLYYKLNTGKLKGRVMFVKFPNNLDVSKYFELYGINNMRTHILNNTKILKY